MITIKRKILAPFLMLIILIPLTTLIIFNAAMRTYVSTSARLELMNTVQTMDFLVKKELAGTLFDQSNDTLSKSFSNIYSALSSSQLAMNTDVLLFSNKGELIYPNSKTDSFLNSDILLQISQKLPGSDKNGVYTLDSGGKSFLMVAHKLTQLPLERTPYIVYLSSLNSADNLINIINLILFLIMLLGIVVGIIISNVISGRISRPVRHLCNVTDNIGRGTGATLPDNEELGIKELALLYNSIQGMSGRLDAYDKAQKTFLQDVSHELRTPLMSIQGYAEGITSGVLKDTTNAAEIIIKESKRLNTIVDELLTLSRIENQTYAKQLIRLNLEDILRDCGQALKGFAIKNKKNIEIIFPEHPIYILGDETLMSQIIINIASNCIKFAEKTVIIELGCIGNDVQIRISDDGKGISDEDLPHIFDRFYKGSGGNMGLGLAIAKSAVDVMGGVIRAYNGDKGAVFEISLPGV